ncbi:hypothetical protein JKA74_11830 [Marivirga sp. S37H4]|uniref:Uncharacterized protein n=1 Tax=Marivirga aurantiaca TaxID=2802615 RepID=A0A934WYV9_9BACT|nr:hypothetical protein [Marivirga aurantiaca]MBK6265728.1 hypothetical protein [Marivirga aurantiaca]
MSGFGMMDFMNKSLANNRAILKRQSLFEIRQELKVYNKAERKYTYKSASKEDLRKIREKMTKERKRNIAKGIFSLVLSIALITITILLIQQHLI